MFVFLLHLVLGRCDEACPHFWLDRDHFLVRAPPLNHTFRRSAPRAIASNGILVGAGCLDLWSATGKPSFLSRASAQPVGLCFA